MTQKCWLGIDVHEKSLEIAVLSEDKTIKFFRADTGNWAQLNQILEEQKPLLIAIDAPSSTNKGKMRERAIRAQLGLKNQEWQNCRVSEYLLGVGGYFWTRSEEKNCARWMRTGFELYNFLLKKGHKIASSEQKGSVLEVHPAYGFRWLISPRKLSKKSSPQGKKQRIEILSRFISLPQKNLNTHNIDALLASLLARFYSTKEYPCYFVGDPEEGQILIPADKDIFPQKLIKPLPKIYQEQWLKSGF